MRITLLLISLLGVFVSAVLLRMSLPSAGPLTIFGSAACAPTVRVNCDYVLGSRWAKIGPIPTAAWGLVYFAVLAAWFTWVGIPNVAGRRWHLFPTIWNAAGAIVSMCLTYAMAVFLPVWCTWCMAAHGVNGALLILTALAWPRNAGSGAGPPIDAYPSNARAAGAIGFCAGLIGLTMLGLVAHQMQITARKYQMEFLKATNNSDYVLWRYAQGPAMGAPVAPDDFAIGRADAPNTVLAFSDFECVHCAGFHRYAARLTQLFPDDVHCVFKHFPLCKECNRHAGASVHYFACEAARAAEAARRVASTLDAYRYQELLFANAWQFDRRPYLRLAKDSGIDGDLCRNASGNADVSAKIASDIELGHRLGVENTPAIFLNGRKLESWNLLTDEAQPKVDLQQTDHLWERLLHTKARSPPAPKAAN